MRSRRSSALPSATSRAHCNSRRICSMASILFEPLENIHIYTYIYTQLNSHHHCIPNCEPVIHAGCGVLGNVIVNTTFPRDDFHVVRRIHNAGVYGVVAPFTALHTDILCDTSS
jgi:hypothetical protein